MYGYIYKTTNIVNNKIYIGQKKSKIFLGEKYLGSGIRLKSAIEHYGKDSFKVKLLEECDSRDEMNEKEKLYIKSFDSQNPDIGYNLASGGDGVDGITAWNKGLTKEQDSRLIQSKETIEKRRESLKKAYKEGRHSTKLSNEARAKMSEKAKNRPHPPTTAGTTCYTNGINNKMLLPDEIDEYIEKGYWKGKTITNKKDPWNKGLTKNDDDRLMKNSEDRKKLLETSSVGFCGCPGNHFSKGQKVSEYNNK